ncbi:YeiH family protein [Dysgonomonas sp. 521]|uniref:YeiH family protein n=1 Tax=Dysgonomonas sp. 521 TaxID=2302932 RepID=UPI0013D72A30|nr:YeiH family protein [Dysgonomonas sp. 521]NDV96988.1 YeiH family protein [Dysgonomonas sp. 521]
MIDQKRMHIIHGILFVALFACAAFYISEFQVLKYLSFSPLIIGIILGMLYGNTLKKNMPEAWLPGITFSSKKLLRLAIVLYGFRLTFQNVVSVGLSAIVIDIIIIAGTLFLGLLLGKLFKIDKEISLLTSTGSAICGAAAILGMEPVLNNKPHKTAIAVSTVVIFGTIAMFLYPVLYRNGILELTDEQWGLYTGATVHEVAHVVGAGDAMSSSISETAIIVKMIRVMFLAPVLLICALVVSRQAKHTDDGASKAIKITIPWFAFGFIAVIGFNSLNLLPQNIVDGINYLDTFLLTMAMTALGMETHLRKFKEAGAKPFVLAFILFLWLLIGGYFIVKYIPVF